MIFGGTLLQLTHCAIAWTDYGARIVFPSGKEISAWPHPEMPHYHVIAHRVGYGDDLLAYCREHELAHIVAAEAFTSGPSYVLHALAHGEPVDQGRALMEEMAALTIQRWVRANERPILSGCDWDALKLRFLGHAERLSGRVSAEQAQVAA
jgi:hypothetical protein